MDVALEIQIMISHAKMNPPSSLSPCLPAPFPSVSATVHLPEKLPALGPHTLLGPPKPIDSLGALRRFLSSPRLLAQQPWTQMSIFLTADALDPTQY